MDPNYFGQIAQIVKQFKISSAIVPGLALAGIAIPVGCVGAIWASESAATLFSWIALVGIAIPALQILFFSLMDRDRLQNEEHVEKKLIIASGKAVIGDRDSIIDIEPTGDLVENPKLEGGARVS